jgi:hypothetical protein
MDNQAQGSAPSQPAAALLRRPGIPLPGRDERVDVAKGPRPERIPLSHLPRTPQKPVLETEEFRVVEPDGSEDPGASADDGLGPEPPAGDVDGQRRKGA